MIRAAVFDIGGVLEIVDDDRWQDQWISRWEGLAGVAPGTLRRSPYSGHSEADFRVRVVTALSLSAEQADRAMAQWWDAYCGELDVAMRDFVASLSRSGLIVAALSNSGDGARREEQRRYNFEELFDHLVYSHEVGVEKPDPAVYRLTEERLGVLPHEIVFLDDRAGAVEGARAAGWHGLLHTSTPESIAAIQRIIASPPH
ncbi:MAG: hydrolase [Rhodoglobus sp.]|nr:hydrolase [Rhodoglobus sp.]